MTSNIYLEPKQEAAALRGIGRIALIKSEMEEIETNLRAAFHWQPSTGLLAEAAWCKAKLEELQASWGRKLVVAIVGPSGAGKSTLLNALAGKELSATGITRPTTRQVIIYTRAMADADELLEHCGADQVQVVTDYHAVGLEHLILVDSPDTNTLPENQVLLTRLLERADLLLALFPAPNPKMHDNVAFLRPFVSLMPQDAVIPVLNWVDRVPLQELQEVILPDFKRWIADEWNTNTPIYLISAKSSTPGPQFAEDERPLHDINQFDALKTFLNSSFNQAGLVNDRRIASAEHLLVLLKHDCRQALDAQANARSKAKELLVDLGQRTSQALKDLPVRSGLTQELSTALYANLSQRWWGPIGWLVMLWSLLLRLGSYLSHLIHRSRLTLPLRRDKTEQESLILAASEITVWNTKLEQIRAEKWPPVTDALVAAGFSNAIRKDDVWEAWLHTRSQRLTELWGLAYSDRLERTAERLSFWLLQAAFNAPTVALIGWLAVQTVADFISGQYLPLDYFRHAGITIGVVWLVSFILLQVIISLTLRGALKNSLKAVLAGESGSEAPLREQISAL
ncbi:MAG: 50S ribosome-binding GTPase, partial [Chloroflexi bacterium]|nr:50S ribosome-binding GTPase [Chloroflexota bacterium]